MKGQAGLLGFIFLVLATMKQKTGQETQTVQQQTPLLLKEKDFLCNYVTDSKTVADSSCGHKWTVLEHFILTGIYSVLLAINEQYRWVKRLIIASLFMLQFSVDVWSQFSD